MNRNSTFRPMPVALGVTIAALLMLPTSTRAQGELIGARGGQLTSTPTGVLSGLNLGGQSVQSGLGMIVSRMAQDGTRGQQLASAIQNLQAASRLANVVQNPATNLAGAANPLTGSITKPVLPSTLNLPPGVQSSLLKGLDSSGAATRHGMGWIVSDAAHQGIHGQQLADVIHQLQPYKQRGVLTFPQNGTPQIFQQPQRGFEGGRGNFGGGKGHGKGKGR